MNLTFFESLILFSVSDVPNLNIFKHDVSKDSAHIIHKRKFTISNRIKVQYLIIQICYVIERVYPSQPCHTGVAYQHG